MLQARKKRFAIDPSGVWAAAHGASSSPRALKLESVLKDPDRCPGCLDCSGFVSLSVPWRRLSTALALINRSQKCQLSRTAAESPAKSQGVPRARASQGHRGQVGSMQVLFSAFFFAYFSRKAALPENIEIKGIVTVTSTLGNAA